MWNNQDVSTNNKCIVTTSSLLRTFFLLLFCTIFLPVLVHNASKSYKKNVTPKMRTNLHFINRFYFCLPTWNSIKKSKWMRNEEKKWKQKERTKILKLLETVTSYCYQRSPWNPMVNRNHAAYLTNTWTIMIVMWNKNTKEIILPLSTMMIIRH